jgi:hypothetical protein
MTKEDLLNLINDDDLGLLTIRPKNSSVITADERLVTSFLEINNFIKEHKREPQFGDDLPEHQLASRLKSLREEKEKKKLLLDFDEYNLFNIESKEIKSIKDIFNDDDFGILDNMDESLFDIRNISKNNNRADADFIAHRKPCKDFKKYEQIFQKCQHDLFTGKRKLLKFKSDKQIKEKSFFVLSGILLFIDEIGEIHVDKYGKIDGRQRCIFENGTESEMLFRSLVKRLYENGYAVSEISETTESDLLKNFKNINEKDIQTGFIYIIKSLSESPKINYLENLYKIGFSSIPVEDRIKKAKEDPTFLMAPVKIIEIFECYNFNPQKMEQLLHNFFGGACLNIDIFDQNNKRYIPREWFIAPLHIIEETIKLIISGGIINYRYDSKNQKIVLR